MIFFKIECGLEKEEYHMYIVRRTSVSKERKECYTSPDTRKACLDTDRDSKMILKKLKHKPAEALS